MQDVIPNTKRTYHLVHIALLVCTGCLAASGQDQLQAVKQLWLKGDYRTVVTELLAYRQHHGATAELDYLLASSLAKLPESRQQGIQLYNWLLRSYKLAPDTRAGIANALRDALAGSSSRPGQIIFRTSPVREVGVGGGPGSLQYYERDNARLLGLRPFLNNTREIERRAEPLQQSDCSTVLSADFRLIDCVMLSAADESTLLNTTRELYDFFATNIGLRKQTKIRTIYLVPDIVALLERALEMDNVQLQANTESYTLEDSRGIVVALRSPLMFDTRRPNFPWAVLDQQTRAAVARSMGRSLLVDDFGDIPPWLLDGILATYGNRPLTTSKILFDKYSWYLDHTFSIPAQDLDMIWHSARDVLTLTWETFRGEPYDGADGAESWVFCEYLLARGDLKRVYEALRGVRPELISGPIDAYLISSFERATGRTISTTDAELATFARTFRLPR